MAPCDVVFYTREGCHLCGVALAVVLEVRRARPFRLAVVDIDRDLGRGDRRFASYTEEVPVIEVMGRKAFKFRVDKAALERALERAAT